MIVVYSTDLHGDIAKYEVVLRVAVAEGAVAIVNGGDMLPNGQNMLALQRRFVAGPLRDHLSTVAAADIQYLALLGNDDLAAIDPLLDEIVVENPLVHNLARGWVKIGNYEFIGFSLAADYPFRLKDRCRLDSTGFVLPQQLGAGLVSAPNGLRTIDDWPAHVAGLPTLEDELGALPEPRDARHAIYVIHMPPAGLGLDVCYDNRHVGSASVTSFIERRQPLATMHGHIHESPIQSGTWRSWVGTTLVIQPGQEEDACVCVVLDLESGAAKRLLVR